MQQQIQERNVPVPDDLLTLDESGLWTGSNLCRLRSAIKDRLEDGFDSVTVDMTYVRHLPSGFFGYLCELHESGTRVRLFRPADEVQGLEWFWRFFEPDADSVYRFREEPLYWKDTTVGGATKEEPRTPTRAAQAA